MISRISSDAQLSSDIALSGPVPKKVRAYQAEGGKFNGGWPTETSKNENSTDPSVGVREDDECQP
jgi:hypothetical protein